jgi:dihydropyrimidinase
MAWKKCDIAIKGGVLVDGERMRPGDIFIRDNIIDGIEPSGSAKSAQKVFDATGKFVLPGIIDCHLHPVYADSIDTISRSAVFGGITTLIPFIGAVKPWGKTGELVDAVKDFIEEAESRSIVDFGIHGAVISGDMNTIPTVIPLLVEMGIISFKAFMAYSKRGMMLKDEDLIRLMENVEKNNGLLAVHAENGLVIDYLENKLTLRNNVKPEYYHSSRPNIVESEAVFRAISFARITRCPLYLVHLSAWESLEIVKLVKEWGEPPKIYTETCPHYLTLTEEVMKKWGSMAKVAPPLRTQKDVDLMWKAVNAGLIDVIASDAAGYTAKMKEPIWDQIFKPPAGLPGVETMFTTVYDEGINKRESSLSLLVKLTSENPAKIFGLYPQKGTLKEGTDADLVIFDPSVSHTIRAENQHIKTGYTIYEGRECLGAPILVIQRGKVLLENGFLIAKPGCGKFLPATPTK